MEGRQREYRLHVEQIEVDIKLKDSLINNLSDENKRQRERMEELEEEVHALEEELKKNEKIEELEQLVVVVKQKNERIEELEEALRQSVRIATDMEMEQQEDEKRKKEINEKVSFLNSNMKFSCKKPANNGILFHCMLCLCKRVYEHIKNKFIAMAGS